MEMSTPLSPIQPNSMVACSSTDSEILSTDLPLPDLDLTHFYNESYNEDYNIPPPIQPGPSGIQCSPKQIDILSPSSSQFNIERTKQTYATVSQIKYNENNHFLDETTGLFVTKVNFVDTQTHSSCSDFILDDQTGEMIELDNNVNESEENFDMDIFDKKKDRAFNKDQRVKGKLYVGRQIEKSQDDKQHTNFVIKLGKTKKAKLCSHNTLEAKTPRTFLCATINEDQRDNISNFCWYRRRDCVPVFTTMPHGSFNFGRGRGCPPRYPPQNYYEEAPPPPPQQPLQPSTSRGRSQKNRARANARRDQYREDGYLIKKEEERFEDKINKTLFFGFDDASEARNRQEFSTVNCSITLPVSTRSAGFIVQKMMSKIYNIYNNIPLCTPWSIYRITLAQIELKLLNATLGQVIVQQEVDENLYYRARMNSQFKDLILGMPVNIAPIANLLHAIGVFSCSGKTYYVRPVNHPVLGVLLSNLREIVLQMSNPNTPLALRMEFYNNNPLPYALWTAPLEDEGRRRRLAPGQVAHPDHPLLLNADQIMPAQYDDEDMAQDKTAYENLLAFLSFKKSPLLGGPCRIDYNGQGHRRQLVSNYMAGIRNPPFSGLPVEPANYMHTTGPTGHLNEFWSAEVIDADEFFVGVLNLLGEIPEAPLMNDAQATRAGCTAALRATHHYATIFSNMMG